MEHLVSRAELETHLDAIARQSGDPRAGIFGPASITWKINREAALFLGAGRAALLQLAHPWVATALAQHSSLLGDPIARFHNTFRIVFTMIFGTRNQALAAARHLHTLHVGIRGELPDAVARWPRGSHYEANEVAALRWVYATLVESAVLAYTCVVPLADHEREQYYQESKTMASLFGIPRSALPENWSAFADYSQKMVASDVLAVSATARSMARAILSGAGSRIRPPRWYRALTTSWIPPRLREEFGLEFSTADGHAAAKVPKWLPHFWKLLPPFVRFIGPYREATARLGNHRVGRLTRASNRFWTGQSLLPFTEGG